MRSEEFSRRLIRETVLNVSDLIYPIFVVEGKSIQDQIPSMPDIFRYSIDKILVEAKEVARLGIPAIAIFPVLSPVTKSDSAHEAYNPDGLVQRCIKELKSQLPDLGIIADCALDPYTTNGHDGITNKNGYIENDLTIEILCKQALSLAIAGADIIAPSDMMDGRIGAIRNLLEAESFHNTKILAYSAKYSSSYYGPFRDAIGSNKALGNSDKKSYQMDPANSQEAIREAVLDLQEGADMVMVKPAGQYLDVIYRIKTELQAPTLAYQVSGEYAMHLAAAKNHWLDEKQTAFESITCIKRAGADAIISYFSKKIAGWIVDKDKSCI